MNKINKSFYPSDIDELLIIKNKNASIIKD
jgi:hypothetical protein